MADNNITIGVKLSENFNRVVQQVAEFETQRLQAAQAQMQAEAARQAQLQKTQKLEMAMDVLRREADRRQAAAAAEKLRTEQQYHMALQVLQRESMKRAAARAESEAMSARDSRDIYQRMLFDRIQLEARTAQTQAQTARTTADTQIQHLKRVEQEEVASAQRRHRMGVSGGQTLNDTNQGGRRGVGWSFLGGQSFRTIGFQLRAIPGGGVPETLGRLSPLADVMAELATGASTAGAGVLGLTAGLVAIGAVIGGLIARSQQLVEGLRKGMQEMAKFARQAEGMPTQDIRGRLTELGFQISRERERQMQLGTERDATRTRLQEMVGGNPYALLGTLVPGSEAETVRNNAQALSEEYDAQAELVRTLSAEQLQLNLALLQGSNAYAEARDELERLIELQDTTEAERNEVIQRNKATMEYLSDLLLSGTLSEEEVAVAEDFYDALHASNVELESINHTFGDFLVFQEALKTAMEEANKAGQGFRKSLEEIWNIARELAVGARTSALSTQTDQLFTEQTNLGNALEAVRKATEAYDEALAEHGERLAQIEADADEKWLEAWDDARQKQIHLDEEYNEKLADQEEEHQERIAKIRKKADDAILTAIANRDALAAYEAMKKAAEEIEEEEKRRQEQLDDIEEWYEDQQHAIDDALNEQLESIKRAADKALEAERKRFADQARDLQAAIDKERSMVQLAEARLQQIRNSNNEMRIVKEYDHQNKLYNIAVAGQDAMLFRTQYFWNAMVDIIKVPGGIAKTAGGGGMAHMTTAAINRQVDIRLNQTLRRGREMTQ